MLQTSQDYHEVSRLGVGRQVGWATDGKYRRNRASSEIHGGVLATDIYVHGQVTMVIESQNPDVCAYMNPALV